MKPSPIFLIAALIVSACGQSPQPGWQVDVRILELWVKAEPSERVFLERMRSLFEAIRDRDWNTVYSMRTAEFRRAVSAEMFTNSAGPLNYTFSGYAVLKANSYVAPDGSESRRLIVRFRSNDRENYNVVWWVNEGGTWYVENLGYEIPGFPFEIALGGPVR